jgi:hypothetical protein
VGAAHDPKHPLLVGAGTLEAVLEEREVELVKLGAGVASTIEVADDDVAEHPLGVGAGALLRSSPGGHGSNSQ